MKILIYLPRLLGPSILSVPFIRSLQDNFPASQISLITNEKFDPLFRTILPEYEQIPLPEIKDIPRVKSTSSRLKKMGFDVGVLLDDSFSSALIFYLARIHERWGYDREGRGFMLTKKMKVKATDPQLHLQDYYLNILNKLGLKISDKSPKIALPSNLLHQAREKLKETGINPEKPIIAIKSTSGYGRSRVWPVDHQIDLIRRLVSELKVQVLLLGSSSGQELGQKIKSEFNGQVIDLIGQLSLPEIPGLLAQTKVFLGNDSGLTHLANFLGIPVVALYGPTDPQICGPVLQPSTVLKKSVPCSPCSYKNCPYDHRCLKNITPEEVFKAITAYL